MASALVISRSIISRATSRPNTTLLFLEIRAYNGKHRTYVHDQVNRGCSGMSLIRARPWQRRLPTIPPRGTRTNSFLSWVVEKLQQVGSGNGNKTPADLYVLSKPSYIPASLRELLADCKRVPFHYQVKFT